MMTDFSRSYSCKWRVYKVNRDTWTEEDTVAGFMSATVYRSGERTLESGSMTVDSGAVMDQGYYRLVLYATQNGTTERHDIATLYLMRGGGNIDHGSEVNDVTAVSVLYPATRRRLELGAYVPKNTNVLAYAHKLLSTACNAPVEYSGDAQLRNDYVFEPNTTFLDAAWSILETAGCCIQITGSGVVRLTKKGKTPTVPLADVPRMLFPGMSYDMEWASVPNRYVAVLGSQYAEAVNDSASSPTSTRNRGFISDPDDGIDMAPKPMAGETLSAYAMRRLKELSIVSREHTYKREYREDVYPYSEIEASADVFGIEGTAVVKEQSIECGRGIVVTEKATIGVNTWER